ncbi:MAG TPA: sigma-70 family RNA polymerase sigma factor [Gaiellaceae bacterium]|nr:sigma-70 family RNA polymerase sigma factor [Gaiellaceae bacterium]
MGVLAVGPRTVAEQQSSRDRLIEENMPLVVALARRYANRGERLEDLVQVGAIGLIEAADRFDPHRGVAFRAFAIPTIIGEIKRHLRDRASTIRLPRREQEARTSLRRARRQIATHLERTPTWSELVAANMGHEDELARGISAERAAAPLSLSASAEPEPAIDEAGYAAGEDRALLWAGLRTLSRHERRAVSLCYFGGLSQREAAASLGISQSATSRTIARALTKMRCALADDRAAFVRRATSA